MAGGPACVLLIVALLVAAAPPALAQPAQHELSAATARAPAATDDCAQPRAHERCVVRCAPGKQIFLPCMAVGATQMAACRAREVAQCEAACARRHC